MLVGVWVWAPGRSEVVRAVDGVAWRLWCVDSDGFLVHAMVSPFGLIRVVKDGCSCRSRGRWCLPLSFWWRRPILWRPYFRWVRHGGLGCLSPSGSFVSVSLGDIASRKFGVGARGSYMPGGPELS